MSTFLLYSLSSGVVVGLFVLLSAIFVWMVRYTIPEGKPFAFDYSPRSIDRNDPVIFGVWVFIAAALSFVAIFLWWLILPLVLICVGLYWCAKRVGKVIVNYQIEKVED